jgi:hypothetical protein
LNSEVRKGPEDKTGRDNVMRKILVGCVFLAAAVLAGCSASREQGSARVQRRPCAAAKAASPDKVTPKLAKTPEAPAEKIPDATPAELADDTVRIAQLERLAEELLT